MQKIYQDFNSGYWFYFLYDNYYTASASCMYMQIRNHLIGCWLFGFYGILTFVGYLMPNPFLYK